MVDKKTYDIILMDLEMPVLNGLEATREIRRGEEKSGGRVPVIVVTANVRQEQIRVAMEAGAVSFVFFLTMLFASSSYTLFVLARRSLTDDVTRTA